MGIEHTLVDKKVTLNAIPNRFTKKKFTATIKNPTEIIELWNTKYEIDIIFIYQSTDAYLNNVTDRQQSSLSQNQQKRNQTKTEKYR